MKKKNIFNSHITIDTHSPYGKYHYYNVKGTKYYIDISCYQINTIKTIANFSKDPKHTIHYTDAPKHKGSYEHLINYAHELSKEDNMKKKTMLMSGTYEQLQEAIQFKLETLRDLQTMYFDEDPDTSVEDQLLEELYGKDVE